MKFCSLLLLRLLALASFGTLALRGENMVSVSVAPLTGVVTVTPRWSGANYNIGSSLTGFHFMAQDLSLGGGANQFYSLSGAAIPAGGSTTAFKGYIAGSGASNDKASVGSLLTPSSYSGLTSADPDIGYGSVNFYTIHHKGTTDYFSVIKPGTAPSVADLKPMSGPGGPATLGASGYAALTFAAANLGHGLNMFYYLRTDAVTNSTFFGKLDPALLASSADLFDLGVSGYKSFVFTGNDVGFGTDRFYFLRLDPVTGFTIFGTLHGTSGKVSDIANLGSVYSAITFASGDVGFGSGNFYAAGTTNSNEQSVSFAAIADKAVGQQFTVTPSASSGLAIALTTVIGSTGAVSISGPNAGVFTITPTLAGSVTLQATQSGNGGTIESNMLRQRFTVSGPAGSSPPVATATSANRSAAAGSAVTLTVTATGSPTPTVQWTFNGAAIAGETSASLTLANVQAAQAGLYRATLTNSAGTNESAITVVAVTSASKVTGTATEVASNIMHANGNVYDQVLLTGAAATVNADANQIVRISFIDLSNDIVQVEFSGAGTLSIGLDGATGPAVAQNYNQPSVTYMKGNARLTVADANETTHLAVFSVGRITAVNQALFRNEVTYDGLADLASVAVLSPTGKFGALRSANASYLATSGTTGVYAPNVQFAGPLYLGAMSAADLATPTIVIGSSSDTRVTGGDLFQANGRAVQVSGLTQLRFVAGTNSHGTTIAAKANRARLEQNGGDVTAQVVVNP